MSQENTAVKPVVLLAREHDISTFASTDPSRYVIQSVHYYAARQCLEACNGAILIRVPVETSEDFPPLSGGHEPATDAIIPIAPFKKALASIPKGGSVPIINHVALSNVNGSQVRLTTNDLDNESSIVAKRIEGNYPNTDQVIPDKPATFEISIASDVLQIIAAYFQKHGKGDLKGESTSIRFSFTDNLSPIRFEARVESGKLAQGVVMPCRMS